MESHGKFGSDPRAIKTVLDEIKSPHLKITLDFANKVFINFKCLADFSLSTFDVLFFQGNHSVKSSQP
jgi:hypothetical protein